MNVLSNIKHFFKPRIKADTVDDLLSSDDNLRLLDIVRHDLPNVESLIVVSLHKDGSLGLKYTSDDVYEVSGMLLSAANLATMQESQEGEEL